MMRMLLLAGLLALAGCRGSADKAGAPDPPKATSPEQSVVQTATLTGLYEGPAGPQLNQMCIIERSSGAARFGIVVWGTGLTSCSGDGEAVRQGDVLRLTMSGDEPCRIEARIEGGRVVLPPQMPAGCAYYCGGGARMAALQLDKTGGTAADAMRAQDLAGDPLCSGAT